jgi:hypothetical protein
LPRTRARATTAMDTGPCGSGSIGEPVLDRFLEGQQLLHARPLRHALEMCRTVPEARQVEFELPRPPLTPEEMRVRRREMIEVK